MTYDAAKEGIALAAAVRSVHTLSPERSCIDALRAAYEAGRAEAPSPKPGLREWLVATLASDGDESAWRVPLEEVLRRLDAEPAPGLHETTRALLAAKKAWETRGEDESAYDAISSALLRAEHAWAGAGCPDAGGEP